MSDNPPFDRRSHWQKAHQDKQPEALSWFQAEPTMSLALIGMSGVGPRARIVDVGGGVSRLADHLLAEGFGDLTVVDLSPSALELAQQRLAGRAGRVRWRVADVLDGDLGGPYDLWHDRAVYHFLTDPGDRARYAEVLHVSLVPGGHAVMATFAPDGPDRCSGLPVLRWDADSLCQELDLTLIESRREEHQTPAGRAQHFMYCLARKAGPELRKAG